MGVRADPGGPRHGPGPARGPPPSLQPYSSPHTQQSPSTLPRPSASEPRPPTPREHRLTALLRETLATANCRTTMIAHVSDAPAHHAETLSTVQLAARVHRLRRKKVKVGSASWAPACVVVLVPQRRRGPRPRSPPGEPEQLTLGTVAAWSLFTQPRGGMWPELWLVPSQAWSCRAHPGALTGSGGCSRGALGPGPWV